MNTNIKTVWAGTCLPAKVFPVVMAGVVLFNLWRGVFTEAAKNVIVALIGSAALWFLCSSGMELLAYVVLAVPVVFIIFLLALIVFDQTLLQVTHRNGGGGERPDHGKGVYNWWVTRNHGCDTCN